MIRIIAGLYRGQTLKTLSGYEMRPTTGRLRQSLFDVLGKQVEGSVFLDCYAGTGAVGLEAVSRGAQKVFFIEQQAAACRVLRQNVVALAVGRTAAVVPLPVGSGLRRLQRQGVEASICFLDPPYRAREEALRSLEWLSSAQLMTLGGILIWQHTVQEPSKGALGNWLRFRLVRQGSNALSFYRLPAAKAHDTGPSWRGYSGHG